MSDVSYSAQRSATFRRWCLGLCMALGLGGCSQVLLPQTPVDAVSIPRSQELRLRDNQSNQAFRLMLWRPEGKPPAKGWPVVYLLDANSAFGIVTDIINSRSRRPEVTGIRPAVVVGLAYPTDEPYDMKRRSFDYTPASDHLSLPLRPNGKPWPPTGGAEPFLRFIQDQVKPLVAATVPVNADEEILIGHSFGGLFTVHTLLTQPEAFDTYVAGSPSLWFNQGQVLSEAKAAVNNAEAFATRRVFIDVGGDEESMTALEQALPDAAIRAKWKLENKMISNVATLVETLRAIPALGVEHRVFAGYDHGSVLPLHLNAGLAFALAPRR